MTISASGISYDLIGTLSGTELSALIAQEFPGFNTPNPQPLAVPTVSRGVTLYRVCYTIDVDNPNYPFRQIVSGLLMVPEPQAQQEGAISELPLAIYNHGTLFGRDGSASNVVYKKDGAWEVGSAETLFNIGLLADKGYALIAADYVGYGVNTMVEGYAVKGPSATAIVDFLEASRSVLSTLNVRPSQLFINGWSQGGMNTQWAVQALEALQIPVTAAAAQSPFNEFAQTFDWWLSRGMQDPKQPQNPGAWLPLCVGIALRSYESWYGLNGLIDTFVKDEVVPDARSSTGTLVNNPLGVTYREVIRRFAERGDAVVRFQPGVFSNDSWQVAVMRDGREVWTTIPGFTSQEMLAPGALDTAVVRAFLTRFSADSPRYWTYSTPLKAWYGSNDEALPPELVAPGMAEVGGPQVTLVPVTGGSHRLTFLNALVASAAHPGGASENLIDWFQSHRKATAASPTLVHNGNALEVVSEDFGLLPLVLEVEQQQGERPLHVEVRRIRKDGTSEVMGTIGGTTATGNQLQSLGDGRLLLQVGERLGFDLLARDSSAVVASRTEIVVAPGGQGYRVVIKTAADQPEASLQLNLRASEEAYSASELDRLGAAQGSAADVLLQLEAGQVVSLRVSSDGVFENRLGFVRLNRDAITGLPEYSVGEQRVAIGSAAFAEQIDALLAPGFDHRQSGRRVEADLQWQVPQAGLYAPVLMTPEGNVFSVDAGDAGAGSGPQLRLLGRNQFGFEDRKGSLSDWDHNDVVVDVIGLA
jgi:hypothetical protein